MIAVLVLIFSAVAALALAFVCRPLWRHTNAGRVVLAGSLSAFVLAIALGAYVFVGHPEMALRSLQDPSDTDVRGLVSKLAWRMRRSPGDPRGWLILARSYLALNDPEDAAVAIKRAIVVSPPAARPALLSNYAVALSSAAGSVTPEAEAAFREALRLNPKEITARFYLGQIYADRRDTAHALAIWQSLLADAPPNAPWRGMLLDRIALLTGATQTAAPNIAAMVQGLADRLKTYPNDPVGWRRLVKAYVVLGEGDKARDALADARKAMRGNNAELAALDTEARDLKLEK